MKCEEDGIDFERINQMMSLSIAVEMDFENKVTSFQSVGMCDPGDPNLKNAIKTVRWYDFQT